MKQVVGIITVIRNSRGGREEADFIISSGANVTRVNPGVGGCY